MNNPSTNYLFSLFIVKRYRNLQKSFRYYWLSVDCWQLVTGAINLILKGYI